MQRVYHEFMTGATFPKFIGMDVRYGVQDLGCWLLDYQVFAAALHETNNLHFYCIPMQDIHIN